MPDTLPRLLIIDDEPETISMLKAFFRIMGFDVEGALDARRGMEIIAHQVPDVLILDLMLPDMDGYALCRQLRADPATARLPIVILSARTSRDDVRRGYEAGASRYIKKPVVLDVLLAEVQKLAARKHEPPSIEVQRADETGR